jgi:hypothetical protein
MTAADAEEAAVAPATPRLPNWAAFALAVALVWLGGQIVRQGVSDNFLTDRSDLAVLWQGDSSDALAARARDLLKGRNAQGGARLAARALQRWPLNEPALTVYGLSMEQLGRPDAALAALSLSGQRGWRDVLAQMWLFRSDILAGRFATGLEHADALMRRQDAPTPIILQILTVAAHDPRAIGPLTERMAANPSWRERLIPFMARSTRPPSLDAAEALLSRLAATSAPPTDVEVAAVLNALIEQGKYQQAEADWRRFEPAGAKDGGLVKNGGFERAPGTTPFDWSINGGVGWTAAIGQGPPGEGGASALKIDYDGVSKGETLQQLVVLAPGSYRLSGRFYDEGGAGAPQLAWTIICNGAGAPLAAAPAPTGPAGGWRPFSVDFSVPAASCPAQQLRLKVTPGDVRTDVAVWYDDLAIAPITAMAPKP